MTLLIIERNILTYYNIKSHKLIQSFQLTIIIKMNFSDYFYYPFLIGTIFLFGWSSEVLSNGSWSFSKYTKSVSGLDCSARRRCPRYGRASSKVFWTITSSKTTRCLAICTWAWHSGSFCSLWLDTLKGRAITIHHSSRCKNWFFSGTTSQNPQISRGILSTTMILKYYCFWCCEVWCWHISRGSATRFSAWKAQPRCTTVTGLDWRRCGWYSRWDSSVRLSLQESTTMASLFSKASVKYLPPLGTSSRGSTHCG